MASVASLRIEAVTKPFISYLQRLGVDIPEALDSFLIEAGELGVQIVREEAPEKTGALKASVIAIRQGDFSVTIGPTVEHAVYVEYGTRSHIIAGKPVLSWISELSGTRVWASYVMHPGTQANPFMRRSSERMTDMLRDLIIKKLREAVE